MTDTPAPVDISPERVERIASELQEPFALFDGRFNENELAGLLRALRSALTARDAEVDRLRKALTDIAAAAPHSKAECGTNPGYACALGLGERAREAIDHG